jgi:two-component system LytT family response regulator
MLNTLIVEDEVLNRDVLRSMIQKYCPDISILGEAESVASAIISIEKLKPELLFLDIELGDGSAFDLLRQVTNPSFNIIFTTAYDQYALRAIKFNALDYLLKPIATDEHKAAVNKATPIDPHNHQNLAQFIQNWSHPKSQNPVITLSTSESFEYIPIRDIVRCEAQGAYTRFHLRDKQPLLVSKTLKEYEPLLQPFSFFRAHQSHLINLSEVVRYIKTDGGYIVLKDGARIGVARTRRDDFLEAMRNLIQV